MKGVPSLCHFLTKLQASAKKSHTHTPWELWLRIVLSSLTYYFCKTILGTRKRNPLKQAVWARQSPSPKGPAGTPCYLIYPSQWFHEVGTVLSQYYKIKRMRLQ